MVIPWTLKAYSGGNSICSSETMMRSLVACDEQWLWWRCGLASSYGFNHKLLLVQLMGEIMR
jgi:hypothetical protein